MNTYNFSRSFLQFTTNRVNHTPRLQIDSVCRLVYSDGDSDDFFLTVPCISEAMYVSEKLVQSPVSEFFLIANQNDKYMATKTFADAKQTWQEVHNVGERMSTYDDQGAEMKSCVVQMRCFDQVRKLSTYAEIREAILNNCLLNGRTSYFDPDKKTKIVIDYPIKICNIAHGQESWQVDTNRILYPGKVGGIENFKPAHIVYNSWDWAEVAVLAETPIHEGKSKTWHYNDIQRIDNVVNEIFSIE